MACSAASTVLTGIPAGDHQAILVSAQQAQACIHGAYERLQHAEALAAYIKQQLGLELCWEIGGDEYNQFKEEAMISKYCVALNELECLVVMCLFELSKLGLSGTGMGFVCSVLILQFLVGYKPRQHINKALQ